MTGLRYNPSGILSSAAATIGQMGSYGQQRASDMALIQQQSAQQNQSDEFAQQQQQEATRLQQAGQLAMQRQNQTLTNANANARQSPFTQAILRAKQSVLGGAQGLDPSEQAAFGADAQNINGSAEDFQSRIAKAVAAHQNTAAKAQVVDAAKDQVDPEDAPLISGMAADPQYSAAHVMQAIQQSMQKKAKKAQVAQDIAAKQSVIQTAQNDKNLTDDDRSAIAPLANDPNTNAQQLQSKVASLRAQNQRASTMAEGQKLATDRANLKDYRTQAAAILKDRPDLFTGGKLSPADQSKLDEFNRLTTQANEIRDRTNARGKGFTNPDTQHRVTKMPDGSVVDAETLDPITREE